MLVKEILKKEMNGNQQILDISSLDRGIYIVQLSNGSALQTTKLW